MTAHMIRACGEFVAMSHDEGGKDGRGSEDKDFHDGSMQKKKKEHKNPEATVGHGLASQLLNIATAQYFGKQCYNILSKTQFYTLRFLERGFSRSISASSSSSSSESESSVSSSPSFILPKKYSIASGNTSFAIVTPTYIYIVRSTNAYRTTQIYLIGIPLVLEKVEETSRF